MRAQQGARGGAAEQQAEHRQRDGQVTGAEDKRPYHPRHSTILELPGCRHVAGLHDQPFERMKKKPIARAATTPRQMVTMMCS
jgi:hypothetical protein